MLALFLASVVYFQIKVVTYLQMEIEKVWPTHVHKKKSKAMLCSQPRVFFVFIWFRFLKSKRTVIGLTGAMLGVGSITTSAVENTPTSIKLEPCLFFSRLLLGYPWERMSKLGALRRGLRNIEDTRKV